MIAAFRQTITDITNLPTVPPNKQDLPDYPYITYEITQSHTPETWSNSRELELFRMQITLNCYAETPQESVMIADDIETFLFDPNFHHKLQKAGIIVLNADSNGISSSDFSGLFNISTQSVIVTLRLLRNYEADFPRISNSNLGGSING